MLWNNRINQLKWICSIVKRDCYFPTDLIHTYPVSFHVHATVLRLFSSSIRRTKTKKQSEDPGLHKTCNSRGLSLVHASQASSLDTSTPQAETPIRAKPEPSTSKSGLDISSHPQPSPHPASSHKLTSSRPQSDGGISSTSPRRQYHPIRRIQQQTLLARLRALQVHRRAPSRRRRDQAHHIRTAGPDQENAMLGYLRRTRAHWAGS